MIPSAPLGCEEVYVCLGANVCLLVRDSMTVHRFGYCLCLDTL